MSIEDYSEIVLDHFMYPRCIGLIDYINGKGAYGDPKCGDYIEIYIYVEDEIIKDIGFLVFGCVGAIACGSMTMVLAKKKL